MQFSWQFVSVLTMTAGTVFLMWLGEQIDEYGIGNGISLLIMGNILARLPMAIPEVVQPIMAGGGLELGSGRGQMGVEMLAVLIVLFVGVIVGVVLISQGQRRIPTQSASTSAAARSTAVPANPAPARQPGRRHAHHLRQQPVVLPDDDLRLYGRSAFGGRFLLRALEFISCGDSFFYNILYIALIYFFCYFWTTIIFIPRHGNSLKIMAALFPAIHPVNVRPTTSKK